MSNIYVISSGTFTITAAVSGATSAVSSSFTIANYVYSITLASTNISPSVNFAFVITATLKAQDLTTYTGAVTITLSGTGLSGTLSTANSAGTASFNVYCTTVGSITITATAPASGSFPAVTATIVETVLIQILKITSFTPVKNI